MPGAEARRALVARTALSLSEAVNGFDRASPPSGTMRETAEKVVRDMERDGFSFTHEKLSPEEKPTKSNAKARAGT